MASIDAALLVAGVDYPTDLSEFDRFFPDEEACVRYLHSLRWREGFVCPKCGHAGKVWHPQGGCLLCSSCRSRTSVTAGTVFAGTRKPLRLWFIAAWEITSHKYGGNATSVKRVLGLQSYKTAWSWLHKLRRAMVRPDRDRLRGLVQVDEMYIGGEEKGVRGRETKSKAVVACAVEVVGARRLGRVRLRRVQDVSGHPCVPSSSKRSSRGPAWSRMHGTGTAVWRTPDTPTASSTSRLRPTRHTCCCRACTELRRC